MTATERLAERMALWVNSNGGKSSVPVLKYALSVVLNYILVFGIVIIICAITGNLGKAIVGVIAMPILRYFSGGIHLKTSERCGYVSAAMVVVAVHLSGYIDYMYTGLVLTIISALTMLAFAPAGIKGYSRLKEDKYFILKIIAIMIVSTNFLFQSPFLALIFFAQAATLPLTKLKMFSE